MVTGLPYERVLEASERYPRITIDGKFLAWWETYLREEGFELIYRPTSELHLLALNNAARIVGMDIPHLKRVHVVAADEMGIIDPADSAPDHIGFAEYFLTRTAEGARFHAEFLAVRKRG
jgi:hypothetical protein